MIERKAFRSSSVTSLQRGDRIRFGMGGGATFFYVAGVEWATVSEQEVIVRLERKFSDLHSYGPNALIYGRDGRVLVSLTASEAKARLIGAVS